MLTILLTATGLMVERERSSSERSDSADVDVLAHNLLIYRNALAEYAYTNPGITGTPPDSALPLPNWWSHVSGVSGYVQAGSSYTYYASPPNSLVTALVELTGSLSIGYAYGGQLVSPSGGSTGVTLPAAVPNGAAVAYR
ncbi:type IV pilus biogenesis protein PilM [Pseudomonas oryzihabitans]|nr:type IV pilus biogenesis protein PilM [Pseudomonas oryzihabitans]